MITETEIKNCADTLGCVGSALVGGEMFTLDTRPSPHNDVVLCYSKGDSVVKEQHESIEAAVAAAKAPITEVLCKAA